MAKKRKKSYTPDFDEIGKNLARMLDVKRRIIEVGNECDDLHVAHRILEELRTYVRMIRLGLEIQLRDGDLEDLTTEQARQAIYGCQMLEDSMQAGPELIH